MSGEKVEFAPLVKKNEIRFYVGNRFLWPHLVQSMQELGYVWGKDMEGYEGAGGDYMRFHTDEIFKVANKCMKDLRTFFRMDEPRKRKVDSCMKETNYKDVPFCEEKVQSCYGHKRLRK